MLIISMRNLNRMEMVGMLKISLFSFLCCCFALTFVSHAQDTSGFISIDCGIPENSSYTDSSTGIHYTSDKGFVDSGVSKTIASQYQTGLIEQYLTVRSFPDGDRNCYTLWPSRGRGNKYLIRARFMYGNYDGKNQIPEFDLYIGVNFWDTVKLTDASTPLRKEIIHVPVTDYISVCFVSKNHGTPFITTLELRALDNSMYETKSGSLSTFLRLDFGSTTDEFVRYKDDVYDRVWSPFTFTHYTTLTTNSTVDEKGSNFFNPPSLVMSSAMVPNTNTSDFMDLNWEPQNETDEFYIYLHFAEIQVLQPKQSRQFNVYLNGELWYNKPVVPSYLATFSVYSTSPVSNSSFLISLNKTSTSTLPPLINAIEIYTVKNLSDALTNNNDLATILSIKSTYGLSRNWQGDPCGPEGYVWVGITCSSDGFPTPRIISLNLSSSGLTGVITPFISNLTMLQTLDLSNNNFTGPVPDFLSRMGSLKVLNLKGNNFSSVPKELLEKSNGGSLTLSIDGFGGENKNTTQSPPSKKKEKNKIVLPIVASVVGVALLVTLALITLWFIKKRKPQEAKRVDPEIVNRDRDMSIEVKNRQFTYSEVLGITKNFQRVIGKGGFGTVYLGNVGETQVAVKMLSPSSIQGYKEFQAEANLLMSVHHKNLTSLVGYCNEGTNMGIIYEYMANGNLQQHLSEKNPNSLSWEERLRITMDAAQGLEYLHHGCKPPIVHRDVKTTNILLNGNFQGKLADFGLSRAFPSEGGTHVSTIVAGTPGYLDPDYYTSNRLSDKSDVYSFGIVILEIITGRPAIPKGNDAVHITQWVNSRLTIGDITNVVDPKLRGDYDVNSVWKAIEIAMECVSRNSTKRPTMNQVVMELKECLAMETGRSEPGSTNNAIGLTTMNFESELGPQAR